ncbi:YrzA family protein [Desertibacillus haloalkaliphilus]|uniref:YrzA family protein n=1 Tax=Desertibacillus haloalkaliphilus TaxID=1328930 RepID=UPI001C276A76|nr:YrzA family protein [Desertibacillus haloalkaliphilus]MBU8905547.1 YrzA family protein [Desertibacillus haloalkaliphilus]
MQIHLETIDDKIECFEASDMKTLEKKINEQIDNNKALLLEVKQISHHVHSDPQSGRPTYTAIVHFGAKKRD